MTKKLLALLLSVVLCVGVLAACGPNKNDGPGKPVSNVKYNGDTPDFQGTTITMHMPNNSDIDPDNTWLNKTVDKHLNVNLKIIEGADLTGMLLEGKAPELSWTNAYSSLDMQRNGRQDGVFVNVYDYLDYMPNLKKFLEDPANVAYVEKYSLAKGEMYNVPIIKKGGDVQKFAFLYRKDIFTENDIAFPTTQEEFVATLQKLKDLYPDSTPFVMRSLDGNMQGMQAFGHLWGGMHMLRGEYSTVFTLDADGKYYLGTTSQAYKEMAMFMKDLMDRGLMHKSSLDMDLGKWQAAFSGEEAFITYDKVDRLPALNNAGKAINPNFLVTAGDPFNFGTYAATATKVSTSFATTGPQYSFRIGNTANVLNVCAYVDWLYSEEGQLMTNWGVKDVSYVEVDGVKTFKKEFIEEHGTLTATGLYAPSMSGVMDFDAYKASCDENMLASIELAAKYEYGSPAQVALVFSQQDNILWQTNAKNFETFTRGELVKFISCQRPFSEWDNVVQEAKADYKYDWLMDLHVNALAAHKESFGK